MTIGMLDLCDPKQTDRLDAMPMLPFVSRIAGYAINRRTWRDSEE